MSMDKPYRVEVTVDAPRDIVWRALTEPEQIRHWFGWDSDDLDAEIEYIFVDHATLRPPDRIEMSGDGLIELEAVGENRTLIRATKPGDLDAAEWQDVYGDIEEGWITFFHQLRHRLAHHPDSARRMIVRTAAIPLPDLPGEPWHQSAYQRGTDVDGSLVIVFAKPDGTDARLLVTTYDLDDEAFAAAEAHWDAWWQSRR
jgi:uncharacterized protein YndB with AHSA1/START domain